MGGLGSGRQFWLRRKTTVEKCLCLSASEFTKMIDDCVSGDIIWSNRHTGEELSSIYYMLLPETDTEPMLILFYTKNGSKIQEPVSFTNTCPHFGGVRWWFTCPMCKKRVGKLYLPTRGELFGCRKCHTLTYKSSQDSKKYNIIYALIADKAGTTPNIVKLALDLISPDMS